MRPHLLEGRRLLTCTLGVCAAFCRIQRTEFDRVLMFARSFGLEKEGPRRLWFFFSSSRRRCQASDLGLLTDTTLRGGCMIGVPYFEVTW